MIDWNSKLSQRARAHKGSEIRRLFAVSLQPGMISFAGGLPDPKSFPSVEIAKITGNLLAERGEMLLQYGPSRGTGDGIGAASNRMALRGIDVDPEGIIVTNGALQAIGLAVHVILDPDDAIIVENPTFIGALEVFRGAGARPIGVPIDNDGIIPDKLRSAIRQARRAGHRAKLLYVIPNFQNPAGVSMSIERRRELLEIARESDLLILEDDPYGELYFRGGLESVRPLKSMEGGERVVYAGTFSKIVSPGIRLGWLAASPEVVERCEVARHARDVCSSPLTQAVVAELINSRFLDEHIERLRGIYDSRCRVMLETLEKYMPDGVSWTEPDGGFFVWVTLPDGFNTGEMLNSAIDNKVAYVSGSPFCTDGSGKNMMRICFSQETEEVIEEGVKRLCKTVSRFIGA